MATLVIKTNAARATPVQINDVGGILIPASGGSETLTDFRDVLRCQASGDLRALATDGAHGPGSSTLILNDGTSDVAQGDVGAFLDGLSLPRGLWKPGWKLVQAVKIGVGVQSVASPSWTEVDCVDSDPTALTPGYSERMGQARMQVRSNADVDLRVTEDGATVGATTVADTGGAWTAVVFYTAAPTAGAHLYCIDGKTDTGTQADVRGATLAILAR